MSRPRVILIFAREMVRLLEEEGAAERQPLGAMGSPVSRLPDGVREVIGRRLDHVSERANELLTMGAVLGREFELDQLEAVDGSASADELLQILAEPIDSDIVRIGSGGRGRIEFSHALIRETLLQELSPTQAVRIHARTASALEELYGHKADSHAQQLLDHFIQADTAPGTDRIVKYAVIAGNEALKVVDLGSAARCFEAGIRAYGQETKDERYAGMLGNLGRARLATLQRTELQIAIDNLIASFNLCVELGQNRAAIEIAKTPIGSIHGPKGVANMLERALELVEEGTADEARLLAEFGLWASHENADYESSVVAFTRAISYARDAGDQALHLRALNNASAVHHWNLKYTEAAEAAAKAIRLAGAMDTPVSVVDSHYQISWHQAESR